MTQEEKELLLKDLCARLSYGVKVQFENKIVDIEYISSIHQEVKLDTLDNYTVSLSEIIPCLRPMSSMTEEEFNDLKEYTGLKYGHGRGLELSSFMNDTYKCLDFYLSEVPSYVVVLVFDWLNAHHFDYRGLIEKGLAIEAPEGMYNDKK